MSCGSISVLAPAKVNFGLSVGVNIGGYHNIASIFQAVSLCDTITARTAEVGCAVRCNGEPMQSDNTIERAYKAFAEVTGLNIAVSFDVEKKIPMCAGLGGGSSDAASAVCALEKLAALSLTAEQKKLIASRVGCDVYFFLLCGSGGCAVVTDRGETVEPIRQREDIEMLLVFPPFGVSTKEAYTLLDSTRKGNGASCCLNASELEKIYRCPVSSWTFVNDFTSPLCVCFPAMARCLHCLKEAGASFCEMSGSGSTLYGIFDTEGIESAQRLLAERLGDDYCIKRVHPYGSHRMQN